MEKNTELLTELFRDKDGVIRNLTIVDLVGFDQNNKVTFDFTGLSFQNAYISNYDYFWDCTFRDTKFYDSWLKKINAMTAPKIPNIKIENFVNSDLDDGVINVLKSGELNEKSIHEQMISDFRSYVGLFLSQGRFVTINHDRGIVSRYKGKRVPLRAMENLLWRYGMVVAVNDSSHAKYAISDNFKTELLNYLMQGNASAGLILFLTD